MYRDLPRGHTLARPGAAGPQRRRLYGAGGAGGDDHRGCVQRHGRDPAVPQSTPARASRFFEFDRPAIAPEESPQQYSTRLLAQIRQRAPIEVAGRKRAAALAGRVPTWSPELAITGKPGGEGALEEALAQTAAKHG